MHEGRDPFDQPPRRTHPVEESTRRLDARPVVAGRAKRVGDRRLSEVVAEDREHERLVVFVAAAQLRPPVEGEQGVPPHVAFGMPARVLGHADERLDLREEPDEARRAQELAPDGRPHPEQEELAELPEDPFRRELREVEPPGEGQQLAVGLQLEAGRELRGAKPAEGVFRELRRVGDAELPRDEVLPASVRIEDFTGEGVETHRVDAEVPPAGGGGEVEVRSDLDRESSMSRSCLVIAAREREIGVEPVDAQDPERSSDRPGSAERRKDRFDPFEREPEDLDVHVGRRAAEEAVAHLPPHEERTARPPPVPPSRCRRGADRRR